MPCSSPRNSKDPANLFRFPVTEFEPLLDSTEAAALLRVHPKTHSRKWHGGARYKHAACGGSGVTGTNCYKYRETALVVRIERTWIGRTCISASVHPT